MTPLTILFWLEDAIVWLIALSFAFVFGVIVGVICALKGYVRLTKVTVW